MAAFFQTVLEMSATAAVVIPVVLVIRLLLRKAPRKYSYALWAVAAFRLVCPVSFRSIFSIFAFAGRVKLPGGGQAVPPPVTTLAPDVAVTPPPAVTLPPAVVVTPPAVSEPMTSVVTFWDVAAVIWLVVLAGLLIYGVASYVRLHRRMANAVLLGRNVYRSDRVRSPFILGFIRPRIYLPFGLTAEQQSYVLAHEGHHLRRLDHIVRPVAFLVLAVHWFNPLVWLAYYLMGRDMEMSCDEKVLGGADNIRKAYSITLLSFAANRRFPSPSPLAFGETGVKGRIKNILNWKKPALWVTVTAVIVVIAVLLVCAANPAKPSAGITAEQEGEYRTVECIYLTPLSSYYSPDGDDGHSYTIAPDHVMQDSTVLEVTSGWEELTEERWNELDFLFWETVLKEKVGDHQSQRILTLSDGWYLMEMDGGLWIARLSHDPNGRSYFWSIYRLVKAGEEIEREPAFAEPTGWFRSVECVFMNGLSSWVPMNGDSGFTYGIEGDTLTMVHNGSRPTLGDSTGHTYHHAAESGWQVLTEETWREMTDDTLILSGSTLWETIGKYENRYIRWYEGRYFLLSLDGEVWVGKGSMHPNGQRYLWDLYRLTPADDPEITVENKLSLTADLNRSGGADLITVSYDHVNETYRLEISESYGMATLLEWEFHRMDTASGGYYLYTRDGKDYLLWWAPYSEQGVWHLFYEVFSFGEGGSHEVLTSGLREYDESHVGDSHLTADLDDLRAFEREINSLLAGSVPILVNQTADGGGILIGGQGGPILWMSPADEWEREREAHPQVTFAPG